jgi:hypothetical protein
MTRPSVEQKSGSMVIAASTLVFTQVSSHSSQPERPSGIAKQAYSWVRPFGGGGTGSQSAPPVVPSLVEPVVPSLVEPVVVPSLVVPSLVEPVVVPSLVEPEVLSLVASEVASLVEPVVPSLALPESLPEEVALPEVDSPVLVDVPPVVASPVSLVASLAEPALAVAASSPAQAGLRRETQPRAARISRRRLRNEEVCMAGG